MDEEARRLCDQPAETICPHLDESANRAVRKTFAILGVNVENPESVEEFRQDLRFGKRMRQIADKGIITAVIIVVTMLVGALGYGIKAKITGEP